MKLPARGRAVGKVILLGEHAVVYGRPAIAAGLGLGIEAEVVESDRALHLASDRVLAGDPRPLAVVAEAAALVGLRPEGLAVRVRSELPTGVGLGSSAAFAVAVLRALAAAAGRELARDEELALGRRLEAVFHGTPSGIDPAAAALGPSCFRFVRGEPPTVTPIGTACPIPVVVGFGDRQRSTGAAVGGLRARWETDPARYEQLFDAVAAVVEEGVAACAAGDLSALGRAFDRNQELLEALGVSAPEVEALAHIARRAGALGAKLTGGGAGGAIVALAPAPGPVVEALAAAGAHTIVTTIAGLEKGKAA